MFNDQNKQSKMNNTNFMQYVNTSITWSSWSALTRLNRLMWSGTTKYIYVWLDDEVERNRNFCTQHFDFFVNFRCISFSERLSNHVWTNMKNPYFYEWLPWIESCPIMKRGRQLPSQKSKSINVVYKWKFSKLTVAKCWPMQFLGPIENWMLQYVGRVLK